MSFCLQHAISNKLLFAQRLEIMNLSDFINSKAKYLRRSHTIWWFNDFGKKCSKQALEIKTLDFFQNNINILNKKVKEIVFRGYDKTSKTFKDIWISQNYIASIFSSKGCFISVRSTYSGLRNQCICWLVFMSFFAKSQYSDQTWVFYAFTLAMSLGGC